MSSTPKSLVEMDREELLALKQSKLAMLSSADKELKGLKKKFKSPAYDRQAICEFIISTQGQRGSLIATLERINGILEGKLPAAQS